jgi:tetratricopeptide (TPR) repeat protein
MLPVFIRYIQLIVWPKDLSVIYANQIHTTPDVKVILAAILLLLIFGVAIKLYQQHKQSAFWIFLFFLGLLPVSQIVPIITLMNDRYLYFPMLGVSGLAGAAIITVSGTTNKYRSWYILLAMILLIPLPLLAYQRTDAWQSPVALWVDAINKSPDYGRAYYGLGVTYFELGQYDKALPAFAQQKQLEPTSTNYELCLGLIYFENKQYQDATRYLSYALEAGDNSNQLKYYLASALEYTGQSEQAIDMYNRILIAENSNAFMNQARQGLQRVMTNNSMTTHFTGGRR